jgi:hypothetical protein
MSTATQTRPMDTVEADWEASAGAGDQATARVDPPPFLYVGTAEQHWLGQPCQPLTAAHADALEYHVAFACGCRGVVPVSDLVLDHGLRADEIAQRAL